MQGSRFSRLCLMAVVTCAGLACAAADGVRAVIGYARTGLLRAVGAVAYEPAPILSHALKAPASLVPKHDYSSRISGRPRVSPTWRMCPSV